VERSTGREWSTSLGCHDSLETPPPSESSSPTPEVSVVRSSPTDLPVHLINGLHNFRHHQLLAGKVQDLEGVVRDFKESTREELEIVSESMEEMKVTEGGREGGKEIGGRGGRG